MNRITRMSLAVVAAMGCAVPNVRGQMESKASATTNIGRYGFRYDPTKWVKRSKSLEAALIRIQVFNESKPGDRERIEMAVQKVFSGQRLDGSFERDTSSSVLRALELGCDPTDPRVVRAVDFIVRSKVDQAGLLHSGELLVVCMTGSDRHARVRDASLRRLAEKTPRVSFLCCPWTGSRRPSGSTA